MRSRVPHDRFADRRATTAGFTLVELVASLAIMSILLVATTSVVLIMTGALPEEDGATAQTITSSDAAQQVASEVAEATALLAAKATAVEFRVADRNDPPDGRDELIRYEWSGTPGDPLTRRYNGGPVVDVVDDVQEFEVHYQSRPDASAPPVEIESPEQVLSSLDVSVGAPAQAVADNFEIAQHFVPNLPAEATSWRLTRVQVRAKKQGSSDGVVGVQLRNADASGLPEAASIEEQQLDESVMGSKGAWYELTYSSSAGLAPGGDGYCLVIECLANPAAGAYGLNETVAGGSSSTDGGASWVAEARGYAHVVYGTFMQPDPDWVPSERLAHASIVVESGSRVITRAVALNQPQMP